MADFFKSALGFISNVGTRDESDFVGQYVELGDQKLRVKRQIAEGKLVAVKIQWKGQWKIIKIIHYLNKIISFQPSGGFAFVFVAEDNKTGKEYALKVSIQYMTWLSWIWHDIANFSTAHLTIDQYIHY